MGMEPVEAELGGHVPGDEQESGHASAQAEYLNKRNGPVFCEVPPDDF